MALPFDIRTCASYGDDSPPDLSSGGVEHVGNRRAVARTLVVAPGVVERVQAHDVEAFRELVRLVYTPLVRFAETIVGSRDDAEDVAQDVLAAVWDLGPRWSPSTEPVAYLFTSVRNRALKELRRRERATRRARRAQEFTPTSATAAVADESVGVLDEIVNAETDAIRVQRVTAVLATLSERQRTVYELRYRRGLTIAAIAEVLGTTVKGAEHLVTRVALRVAERLRQESSDRG